MKKQKQEVQITESEMVTKGGSVQEKTVDAFVCIFNKADKSEMTPFNEALENSTSPGHVYNIIAVLERFCKSVKMDTDNIGRASATLRKKVSDKLNSLKGSKVKETVKVDESYI